MERAGDRGTLGSRVTQFLDARKSFRKQSMGQSAELFWRTQYELLQNSGVTVDRRTFMQWLQEPNFLQVLENADVDVSNKFDLFDVLDADMGGKVPSLALLVCPQSSCCAFSMALRLDCDR